MSKNITHKLLPFIIIAIIPIVIFFNTLQNGFIWDDEDLILKDGAIKNIENIPFLWKPRYWNEFYSGVRGQYRPVRSMTFVGDFLIWKTAAAGYHLTNLLLHILNTLLVYILFRQLIRNVRDGDAGADEDAPDDWPAFLGALLFASHPMHIEAVSWIKNRSELLAALFFLAALILFFMSVVINKRSRWGVYALSLGAFWCSLCSKEMALSLPFIMVCVCVVCMPSFWWRKKIWVVIPFFMMAGIYLLFKIQFLGTAVSPENLSRLMPTAHIRVVIKTIGYYLWLLIMPFKLNAERVLIIPDTFYAPAILGSLALIVLAVMGMIKSRARYPILFLGGAWIFITLLPAINIIFLASRPIAEQRLYIPSIGFCLFLGYSIYILAPRLQFFFALKKARYISCGLTACIVCMYSVVTIQRNPDWRDSITFWSKTVESSPYSARAHNNLGDAYLRQGQPEQALPLLRRAIELDANYATAYNNLGDGYIKSGKAENALPFLERALELDSDYATAYNNMGVAYIHMGDLAAAQPVLQKAITLDPHYARAYSNLGAVYGMAGDVDMAISLFQRSIRIDPVQGEVYDNLALAYLNKEQFNLAIQYYEKAREKGFVNSEHVALFEFYKEKIAHPDIPQP